MGSTYLALVNKVCKRLNEVPLSNTNFATARSTHSTIKEAVNDSIRRINQKEQQWPFNRILHVQTVTPFINEYPLPLTYKVIDKDTVYLRRDVTENVSGKHLRFLDYDEYVQKYKSRDEEIMQEGTTSFTPEFCYLTPDDKIGITPAPSIPLHFEYQYWTHPEELSVHSSICNIPSRYDGVIVDGAMQYMWVFRENESLADRAETAFNEGIANMRTLLINKYEYVRDRRSSGYIRR